MKAAVFTSNQPRHFSLIRRIARVCDEVFVVQECDTLFPGEVADFYRKSEVMARYFAEVRAAEAKVFGEVGFLPANVRALALKSGDINRLPLRVLEPALAADCFVVYGASYLKGEICRALVDRRAVNIHMGVSPYYRGSACNFWAMYDRRPEMVGATIHLLSAGLDSGGMLFHAFPAPQSVDPFEYGMLCVKAAHVAVANAVRGNSLAGLAPVAQDRGKEIRYTRTSEFTDDVAAEYLSRLPSPAAMAASCSRRALGDFVRPQIVEVARDGE